MIKTHKKAKKTNSITKERHFGVVLEDIDSKLDLVVEGHQSLDKKIDRVESELKGELTDFRKDTEYRFTILTEMTVKNTEDIEIIKTDLNTVKGDLGAVKTMTVKNTEDIEIIKTDLNTVKGDLGAVKTMTVKNTEDIEIIKTDIEFIKSGFKKKVDLEEFEHLERRVVLLEKKVS